VSRVLPIYETFNSWQGEGCHLGRSAFFIRTHGCPIKCPWCDSAGTWHPNWTPDDIQQTDVTDLAARARASGAEFVVVTGGEPTLHDLGPLTRALAEVGLPAHLETSGAFEIRGAFDWVTLSPKWARLPLEENYARANEIKIIVEDEGSIDRWIAAMLDQLDSQPVWLHPEWSQRNNPKVLRAISDAVKTKGDPFRAGFQIHRLYGVDAFDRDSRPAVPLGGDPVKGY
jgi:organic radical activating enzyme